MSFISINSASATDNGAYTYNQDRAYVGHETCAVFDGHGTYGEEVAMWCVELLAAADKEGKTLDFAEVQAALRARLMNHGPDAYRKYIFHETQGGIYDTRGQPVRGGTTASILRIDRTTGAITCASVGDSEVRYFDCGADAPADGTTLCGDHTATNPEEYARVLAFAAEKGRPAARFAYDTQGGRLSREDRCPFVRNEEDTAWVPNPAGGFFHCDVRESWGAYIFAPNGEGLAMTRALGDFNMSRYGVSQEAHVVTAPPPALQENTQMRAVVWASDGMWDLLPYADVGAVVRRAEFVVRGDDGQIVAGRAAEAAAALLELAKERTRAAFGSLGDNITVGVSYIVYPRAPPPPPAAGFEPAAAGGAGAPAAPELDLAFLLSGSPFKRESLFTALHADDISVIEPAELLGPVALPGSTEDLLHGPLRVDPEAPEARWMRAGSPAERAAILATLEADHPLHCHLHRDQILPGRRLRRSRNTGRSYGMYAPSCSGCRIGAAEEAADAAEDAELKACTQWLNLRMNDLADASIADLPASVLADRRAEVEGGMFRLEACDAWSAFGDPAVMRAAEVALAADDAAADIRRAMSIIAEAKDILRTATGRLRATPRGAGYAAYKAAMAFLAANP